MNSDLPIWIVLSEPIFGILLTSLSFIIYFYAAKSKPILDFIQRKYPVEKAIVYKVIHQKVSGFFFLGFLPLIVILFSPYAISRYGLNLDNATLSFYWIISLAGIIFLLSFVISGKPENYKIYPHIRLGIWDYKTVALNSISWIVYLLAYEFIFRGVLLFACARTFDISIAIGINVIIYAIAHIPNGKMETIGSIPIGILLCYITISTGSIWSAFVLHLIMALSNDYISLSYNPAMKISKFK